MQLDLQTINIKPLRQTFDHLAARFGDKPASRYQEGTYDLQQTSTRLCSDQIVHLAKN